MPRTCCLLLSIASLTCSLVTEAGAQPLHVVNAASFSGNSVAPGSIVTIFGSNLTNSTASVTDPANPPVTLAGTSVEIGGTAAMLFFVSPTQINAVVSATVAAGTQPVVVLSPSGTTNGSVVVSVSSPPGLFSMTGTGTNDGAIIQSLTGRVGAFSVFDGTTATYLSLFLTGANLTATPVVTVAGVSVNVAYAGASPCCSGLQQINVTLPASLQGAGRVPVMVQAGGQFSNVVEIVILPAPEQGEFSGDLGNRTRSRELSSVASVPGTSLALVADENDDVIREVDLAGKNVVHTIALAENSEPAAVSVNSAGTIAVVAERSRARAAVINLSALTVAAEVPVGAGPLSVAITGSQAVVVNGDSDTVTVVDLIANTPLATVDVGRGPRGVAIDATGHAYITNEDDGTISVIDLSTYAVTATLRVSSTADGTGSSRPAGIQIIPGSTFALVADPAMSPDGKVLVVNLATGATTSFSVNVAHTSGSNDIAMSGMTAYVANQAGGSISVLPLTISGSTVTGTATTIRVDQGVRSLTIDSRDGWLAALNESSGKIAVVSLASDQVIARISAAVAEPGEGDDDGDDHSDHDHAANLPHLTSIAPNSAGAGATFTITITGTNLTGASSVAFVDADICAEIAAWLGKGADGLVIADSAFTITAIQVNAGGTQLTATIAIAANASPGVRVVRVATPNGNSAFEFGLKDTFTVQ